MEKSKIYAVLLFLLGAVNIKGEIKLPAVISDNMVLQQNTIVKLWGKAGVLEEVELTTSWSDVNYLTKTDENGNWIIGIVTPPDTHKSEIINIRTASSEVKIKNILIGEVWLCSGQSNMDFPVAKEKGWKTGIVDEELEMQDADFDGIRIFHVAQKLSPYAELDDCEGEWMVCNPENLKDFSAVAFFFGKRLHQNLQVPVGLIQSTWGGTHAESWTKMSEMETDPVYADLVNDFNIKRENYESELNNYQELLSEYNSRSEEERMNLTKPKKPSGNYHNKALSTLWNGMIHPLIPYTIKGVVWYQGESNSIRHHDYEYVFSKMINSWRSEWQLGDFPFYFVQIAPHYKQPPEIREAQLETWKNTNNTGMVVIADAADSTDIHPRLKQVPGKRLAAWALAKTYGVDVPYCGPVYLSHEVDKNKLIVFFDHADGGIISNDGNPIVGFRIAGVDKKFYQADVQIEGHKLILSSPDVSKPVAIRYGWDKFFRVNFYNGAGFPASPFRTDRWVDSKTD